MAYENRTYPFLLNRMMDVVREKYPELDYREGSIIFDALAPAALELAIAYTELDNVLKESFVPTASRQYILLGCEEVGIDTSIFDPTAGEFSGMFNIEVPIGSRWNLDIYNYEVIEEIDPDPDYQEFYWYRLRCETVGSAPNGMLGNLTPIDIVSNELNTAILMNVLLPGADETPDNEIVDYYTDAINNRITDGNVKQYEVWCDQFPGIGRYKILSLWNGPNTVKCSILDDENGVASEELIEEFQDYLDPNSEGMGNGVAPIGAIVTVSTATTKQLNIGGTIHLKDGYEDYTAAETAVKEYLNNLAYTNSVVSYIGVAAAILDAPCTASITNVLINAGTNDIQLGNEEIPVLGQLNLTVV